METQGSKVPSFKNDINVTPFVDIALVLLIIFMVIMPVAQMVLDIAIPEQSPPPDRPVQPPDQVLLRMTADSRIFLNTEPVPLADLGSRIAQIYLKRTSKTLFFYADNWANYGEAAAVMDICRNNGVGAIGLVGELRE